MTTHSQVRKWWTGLANKRCRVDKRDLEIKGDLKYIHANKDVPREQHYEESSHTFPGKSAQLCASLKGLYTNACSVGSKKEEFQLCVPLLQSHWGRRDVVG